MTQRQKDCSVEQKTSKILDQYYANHGITFERVTDKARSRHGYRNKPEIRPGKIPVARQYDDAAVISGFYNLRPVGRRKLPNGAGIISLVDFGHYSGDVVVGKVYFRNRSAYKVHVWLYVIRLAALASVLSSLEFNELSVLVVISVVVECHCLSFQYFVYKL